MENQDIKPPKLYVDNHAALSALIANPLIIDRFDGYERDAVAAKRFYTATGAVSLFAAGVAMSVLIWMVTLGRGYTLTGAAAVVLAIVGAIGLVAQGVLFVGRVKRKWLAARFGAERIRAIKFEAFQLATVTPPAHLAAAVAAFTLKRIAQLDVEIGGGRGAIRQFNAEEWLASAPALDEPDAPLDPVALGAAKQVYRELRLDVQMRHAARMADHLEEQRRTPMAFSEVAFWAGACLAFYDLALALPLFDWPPLAPLRAGEDTRHFFTLVLFVLSAILFVYQRGRGDTPAIERYAEYRYALARASADLAAAKDAAALRAAMRQVELIALGELRAFMREADGSTYLL